MTPPIINVNVCIVMDCTASMGPWIREAKTKMAAFVNEVHVQNPRARVLVGFVGYRDYDDTEPFVLIPFMNAADTMEHIKYVYATGGNDQAEDVAHGLQKALHMDWSGSDVKIVFHVADAPAHGMMFHDVHISDRFPRGDPEGLDPRDIVERMSFLDIEYTFVRIDKSTDTMIEQFHNCYTQGGTFTMIDLMDQDGDPRNMSEEMVRSINRSIGSYTISQETQCCSQNPTQPSDCED